MSAQGTAAAKKSITKGQQMAREMAKQLGGVAVKAGSGGMTLMSKAEVKRRELIDAEKAKLAAREQPAAAPVLNSKGKKATKREIASRASVARGREKPTLTIVPAAPAGVPAGGKFCKRHNMTHPLEAFASDRSSKDGRYSICREAEKDDRAAKKARLAAAATPPPIAAAAMPQTVKKAKKVSRKK